MVEEDSFGKFFIDCPRMNFFGNGLTRCRKSQSVWVDFFLSWDGVVVELRGGEIWCFGGIGSVGGWCQGE